VVPHPRAFLKCIISPSFLPIECGNEFRQNAERHLIRFYKLNAAFVFSAVSSDLMDDSSFHMDVLVLEVNGQVDEMMGVNGRMGLQENAALVDVSGPAHSLLNHTACFISAQIGQQAEGVDPWMFPLVNKHESFVLMA
jgi:hypothetical protein